MGSECRGGMISNILNGSDAWEACRLNSSYLCDRMRDSRVWSLCLPPRQARRRQEPMEMRIGERSHRTWTSG